MNLTPKQLRILQLIRDSRLTRGYSPTMQELADELGVSKVTVFEHVEALIKKGALLREPNKARSLSIADGTVVPDEQRPSRFPLLGRIAAGYPIEKFEQREELDVTDFFGLAAKEQGCFALQVEGDSMRDENICDGDYVIVRRSDTAQNGERVVALLPNGETTLKRFFREGDQIRLQPANDAFEPIIVKDCRVQGIVVGVLRRY
ncbi:MAG: transcriptional repressor LexA [Phycisphaerales bacterium]|nr:transcriptional repressor LexA [Phycisphaerales bacterium]